MAKRELLAQAPIPLGNRWSVSLRGYVSAGPMIAICADQQNTRTRAFPGYASRAVPVLPWRISRSTRTLRYPSDMTGTEWAVTEPRSRPRPGPSGKAAARRVLPPGHRGRDPVPGQGGHPVAGHAGGPAALAHRVRVRRRLAETGETGHMHDELRRQVRIAAGRSPSRRQRSSIPSRSRLPRPSARAAATRQAGWR